MPETPMTPDGLLAQVDWDAALAAPRYAGGHEEVLRALFKGATVLAEYSTKDYQGTVAMVYQLANGVLAVVSDYYGSCSGCDSWEDAGDAEARKMIHDLATTAHPEPTRDAMLDFLERTVPAESGTYYALNESAASLATELRATPEPRAR